MQFKIYPIQRLTFKFHQKLTWTLQYMWRVVYEVARLFVMRLEYKSVLLIQNAFQTPCLHYLFQIANASGFPRKIFN